MKQVTAKFPLATSRRESVAALLSLAVGDAFAVGTSRDRHWLSVVAQRAGYKIGTVKQNGFWLVVRLRKHLEHKP